MKDNERENDIFDELLRDALASDAVPSDDFTARLMEQVRRTPQEKSLKKQPVVKLLAALAAGIGLLLSRGGLAALAACAVIVVAIPLVTGSMGGAGAAFDQAASADCAEPEAALNGSDDRAGGDDNQMMYSTAPNTDSTGGAPDDGLNSQLKQNETPGDNENLQTLTLVGQDAKDAKAALDAMDIQPTEIENGRYTYDLTQQQVQELGQTVDALYGAEDCLILILEVTE